MAETICCEAAAVTSMTRFLRLAFCMPFMSLHRFSNCCGPKSSNDPGRPPSAFPVLAAPHSNSSHSMHSASRWSRLDRTVRLVHIRPTNNTCCSNHNAFNSGIVVMGKINRNIDVADIRRRYCTVCKCLMCDQNRTKRLLSPPSKYQKLTKNKSTWRVQTSQVHPVRNWMTSII